MRIVRPRRGVVRIVRIVRREICEERGKDAGMEATTTAVTMAETTREGTDRSSDSERNRCVMKARQKEEARYRTQSDQHVVAMVMAEVEAVAVAKKVTEEKEAAVAVVERETVTFMEARSGKQVMKRDKAVVFHDSTGTGYGNGRPWRRDVNGCDVHRCDTTHGHGRSSPSQAAPPRKDGHAVFVSFRGGPWA